MTMRGSRPPGMKSFTTRKPSGRKVRTIAATIDPEIDPSPPRTTMATTSNDFTNVNMPGMKKKQQGPIQRPCHTGQRGADDERLDLVARRIDAHRLGRDLVLTHGQKRTAHRGRDQTVRDQDCDAGKEEHPEETAPAGDAGQTARGADLLDVEDQHADDLSEPERHDVQVVTAQSKRR